MTRQQRHERLRAATFIDAIVERLIRTGVHFELVFKLQEVAHRLLLEVSESIANPDPVLAFALSDPANTDYVLLLFDPENESDDDGGRS